MASLPKILASVLSGTADANMRFNDLRRLLDSLGFQHRVKGDHFIYVRTGVAAIINIQPLPGGKAKAYQVKQVRQIITQHGLQLGR